MRSGLQSVVENEKEREKKKDGNEDTDGGLLNLSGLKRSCQCLSVSVRCSRAISLEVIVSRSRNGTLLSDSDGCIT